ncbi:hypothetical protein CP061683_1045A, partial [Chlamydia psittaci 06-1683]
MRRLLAK